MIWLQNHTTISFEKISQHKWSLEVINPNHTGLFGLSKNRRGVESTHQLFWASKAPFPPKSVQTWSQKNLESLYTYRSFEKHPRVCSFAVTWQQSKIVWLQKFFSFLQDNIQKCKIFHLYEQYMHQMKAENILKSNSGRITTISHDFLAKLDFQKFLLLFCPRKKFLECNFFKNFLYNSPKLHF